MLIGFDDAWAPFSHEDQPGQGMANILPGAGDFLRRRPGGIGAFAALEPRAPEIIGQFNKGLRLVRENGTFAGIVRQFRLSLGGKTQ